MKPSKTSAYWEKLIVSLGRFVFYMITELYDGIRYERINVTTYIYPGTFFAMFFAFRIDLLIALVPGLEFFRLPAGLRAPLVYTTLFAGWIIWAGERAFHRTKVLARLRDAFIDCGLESNRKLPSLIKDEAIDDHVRRLKIFASGIPLKKFIESREILESHLNISVVKMTEEVGDKSRIQILYAIKGLSSTVSIDDPSLFVDGEIPIGMSYEGPLHVNIRDVAHILVAGQSGGGKSNILKVITSTLTLNNPESDVCFLDFKGGMELADLVNKLGDQNSNFHHAEGTSACAAALKQFGLSLETRLRSIAKAGAANFDDYLKKSVHLKRPTAETQTDVVDRAEAYKRTYIVIDEIAQLYTRDTSVAKEDLMAAREAVNRIARQGRAAGVHLIVATQKPDAASFDQTVKANLPAVLCFPMVSQAASISALGTKRAYDLNPEIKGRAVWKFGPKFNEVQTYFFE